MDHLYDDADLYDLVAPVFPEMEQFYVGQAGGPGRRVLELACGTGRIAVQLAESGAIVTGGDLSASMLEQARVRAAERGVGIELVRLDMRSFELHQQFDAVVIAANSLMHLHSHEDFSRAFSAIRQHLASGGKLLFDVFVPNPALLCLPIGQREPLGSFTHAHLGEVTVEETICYDATSQISRADWYWSTAAHRDFRHTPLELRQIFPQELPLLLALGGLELETRYGDFDGSPLTSRSARQVCVAAASP